MYDAATMQILLERSMPEPNSGCWLWLGYACKNGYGRIRHDGNTRLAHRVAWVAMHGSLPKSRHLCHKCDNPGCINPAHMFIGTQTENVRDMMQKGREGRQARPYHRGEKNPNSRITADVVRAILLSPLNQKDAAKAYGVAPSWVQKIRKREVWKHIEVPADQIPPRMFFTKLTAEKTVALRKDPRPARVVADHYGVSWSMVCRIRRGYAWKTARRLELEAAR